jgi:hypothetical protein
MNAVKKQPKLTLQALRNWLRKKRKLDVAYCYLDKRTCLIALFTKSQGFKKVTAHSNCVMIGRKRYRLYSTVNDIAISPPYTFRGALRRAENALRP